MMEVGAAAPRAGGPRHSTPSNPQRRSIAYPFADVRKRSLIGFKCTPVGEERCWYPEPVLYTRDKK
jgi:hypothetical protein